MIHKQKKPRFILASVFFIFLLISISKIITIATAGTSSANQSLAPASTSCEPCREFVAEINRLIRIISDLDQQIAALQEEINVINSRMISNAEGLDTLANAPREDCIDGKKIELAMIYQGEGETRVKNHERLATAVGTLGTNVGLDTESYSSFSEMVRTIDGKLRKPIDKKGVCRDCLKKLHLVQHGYDREAVEKYQRLRAEGKRGERAADLSGTYQFGDISITDSDVTRDGQMKTGRARQSTLTNLALLRRYLCEDGVVVFHQCNIGFGDKGDKTGQALSNFLGVPVNAPTIATSFGSCSATIELESGDWKQYNPSGTPPPVLLAETEPLQEQKNLEQTKTLRQQRLQQLQAERDRYLQLLQKERTALVDCEEKNCKRPGELGRFFGDIFGPGETGKPVRIDCTGGGCTEQITGSCTGADCPDSIKLNCPGSGCPENVDIGCSGDSCKNEITADCEAGRCDKDMDFFCGEGGCTSDDTPDIKPLPPGFEPVLDDLQPYGLTGQGTTPSTPVEDRAARYGAVFGTYTRITTNCAPCQSIVDQINAHVAELEELDKQYAAGEQEYERAKIPEREAEERYNRISREISILEENAPQTSRDRIAELKRRLEVADKDWKKYVEQRIQAVLNLDRIRGAAFDIKAKIDKLRKDLAECEKQCAVVAPSSTETGVVAGGGETGAVTSPSSTPAEDRTARYGAVFGTYTRITTNCAPCQSIVDQINAYVAELEELDKQYAAGEQEYERARIPEREAEERYSRIARELRILEENAPQTSQRRIEQLRSRLEQARKDFEKYRDQRIQAVLNLDRIRGAAFDIKDKIDKLRKDLAECEKRCREDAIPKTGCIGNGCSDDFGVLCSGDSCPETFTLNCGSGTCPEYLQLDCTGSVCPEEIKFDCDAGGCPEQPGFICTDNECNYVPPADLFSIAGAGVPLDYGSINFDGLDAYIDDQAYSDGTFQIPYGGTALNTALGLGVGTAPPTTLQQLLQAEQQAVQNAIDANNYANTVADAFQQSASVSIQTASSLAAATEAAGVQEFLIDFGSALADLASVSDFFEGLAKGDMSDNSLLQNLDSIYEAAKDGESLANNIADQIQPIPEGSGISTSPINDVFGTMGVANDYWGTEGVTDINSLKSDFSDIANLIDDHRSGKPINPRTLGQLIVRIGKGYAESDLKERKEQIANLQQNLAAEQRTTSGLAGQLQTANEAKWNAMDELESVRAAIAALLASNPESLSVAIGGASPVEMTTAKCAECQPIADQINQATLAIYAARQQIAAIQARQSALEAKKAKLQQLQNQLESANRVLNTARAGLESTDVPVLGPAQEIQNRINLLEMDRRQLVNEIGRLEREIEIEDGDPEAEIAILESAIRELRDQLRDLRYDLSVCEEDNCKEAPAFGQFFGEIFSVEVIDVKNISGNNPFDERDPIAENTENVQQPGGATVLVINNIPINRLFLTPPGEPGCAPRHYHGAANNCNGVLTPDPAPANCGHGVFGSETAIPVSSCPDF